MSAKHGRGNMRGRPWYGRPWLPLPKGHDREIRALFAWLFGSYRRGRRIRRQESKALRAQEAAHG